MLAAKSTPAKPLGIFANYSLAPSAAQRIELETRECLKVVQLSSQFA